VQLVHFFRPQEPWTFLRAEAQLIFYKSCIPTTIKYMGGSVTKSETPHSRLDAQDVVVHREQLLLWSLAADATRLDRHGHLGVIDTREVAGAGGLVLLGLQGEGVHVDAGVRAARVVHEGLVLVEVLAQLLLEAILAVEDNLELVEWTDLVQISTDLVSNIGCGITLLDPCVGVGTGRVVGGSVETQTNSSAWAEAAVEVQVGHTSQVRQNVVVGVDVSGGVYRNVHVLRASRKVPKGVEIGGGTG